MEYVMVPVPEEYVAQVSTYLQWNTGPTIPDLWPDDDVARFLDGLDDQARTILLHAAQCSNDVVVLSIRDLAQRAGCSEREVVGTLAVLNDAARTAGGPAFVVGTGLLYETTATGPEAWSVNMPGQLGQILVAAGEAWRLRQGG